jgi:HSP20 family protein
MLAKRDFYFPTVTNFLGDFFDKEFADWTTSNFSPTQTTLPAVNIRETEDNFVVVVAAPGMLKSDFKIHLDDHLLTVSSERKEEKTDEKKGKYTRKEYSYQSFTRSFTLPKEVTDSQNITAQYVNGELIIVIPKNENAKPLPPKEIQIS